MHEWCGLARWTVCTCNECMSDVYWQDEPSALVSFFFRKTVPVEKCIQPEVPSSPRLLFRIFITVIFLTLTYPSRHKNFSEHPKKDTWVEIWHHHLEKVCTKLSENLKTFLIGQWEKDSNRQMVKMQRTFQNHQSNVGCSNFFNLKPNAGTKTNFSTSTQKSKRFFGSQVTASRTQKELAVVKEETKQKGIRKMHRRVFLFQNEKSP